MLLTSRILGAEPELGLELALYRHAVDAVGDRNLGVQAWAFFDSRVATESEDDPDLLGLDLKNAGEHQTQEDDHDEARDDRPPAAFWHLRQLEVLDVEIEEAVRAASTFSTVG